MRGERYRVLLVLALGIVGLEGGVAWALTSPFIVQMCPYGVVCHVGYDWLAVAPGFALSAVGGILAILAAITWASMPARPGSISPRFKVTLLGIAAVAVAITLVVSFRYVLPDRAQPDIHLVSFSTNTSKCYSSSVNSTIILTTASLIFTFRNDGFGDGRAYLAFYDNGAPTGLDSYFVPARGVTWATWDHPFYCIPHQFQVELFSLCRVGYGCEGSGGRQSPASLVS